jgi:phosphatidylserine decarboxylase
LAYFEFGSTVVLLLENDTFTCLNTLSIGSKIRMGQSLGILHPKNLSNTFRQADL